MVSTNHSMSATSLPTLPATSPKKRLDPILFSPAAAPLSHRMWCPPPTLPSVAVGYTKVWQHLRDADDYEVEEVWSDDPNEADEEEKRGVVKAPLEEQRTNASIWRSGPEEKQPQAPMPPPQADAKRYPHQYGMPPPPPSVPYGPNGWGGGGRGDRQGLEGFSPPPPPGWSWMDSHRLPFGDGRPSYHPNGLSPTLPMSPPFSATPYGYDPARPTIPFSSPSFSPTCGGGWGGRRRWRGGGRHAAEVPSFRAPLSASSWSVVPSSFGRRGPPPPSLPSTREAVGLRLPSRYPSWDGAEKDVTAWQQWATKISENPYLYYTYTYLRQKAEREAAAAAARVLASLWPPPPPPPAWYACGGDGDGGWEGGVYDDWATGGGAASSFSVPFFSPSSGDDAPASASYEGWSAMPPPSSSCVMAAYAAHLPPHGEAGTLLDSIPTIVGDDAPLMDVREWEKGREAAFPPPYDAYGRGGWPTRVSGPPEGMRWGDGETPLPPSDVSGMAMTAWRGSGGWNPQAAVWHPTGGDCSEVQGEGPPPPLPSSLTPSEVSHRTPILLQHQKDEKEMEKKRDAVADTVVSHAPQDTSKSIRGEKEAPRSASSSASTSSFSSSLWTANSSESASREVDDKATATPPPEPQAEEGVARGAFFQDSAMARYRRRLLDFYVPLSSRPTRRPPPPTTPPIPAVSLHAPECGAPPSPIRPRDHEEEEEEEENSNRWEITFSCGCTCSFDVANGWQMQRWRRETCASRTVLPPMTTTTTTPLPVSPAIAREDTAAAAAHLHNPPEEEEEVAVVATAGDEKGDYPHEDDDSHHAASVLHDQEEERGEGGGLSCATGVPTGAMDHAVSLATRGGTADAASASSATSAAFPSPPLSSSCLVGDALAPFGGRSWVAHLKHIWRSLSPSTTSWLGKGVRREETAWEERNGGATPTPTPPHKEDAQKNTQTVNTTGPTASLGVMRRLPPPAAAGEAAVSSPSACHSPETPPSRFQKAENANESVPIDARDEPLPQKDEDPRKRSGKAIQTTTTVATEEKKSHMKPGEAEADTKKRQSAAGKGEQRRGDPEREVVSTAIRENEREDDNGTPRNEKKKQKKKTYHRCRTGSGMERSKGMQKDVPEEDAHQKGPPHPVEEKGEPRRKKEREMEVSLDRVSSEHDNYPHPHSHPSPPLPLASSVVMPYSSPSLSSLEYRRACTLYIKYVPPHIHFVLFRQLLEPSGVVLHRVRLFLHSSSHSRAIFPPPMQPVGDDTGRKRIDGTVAPETSLVSPLVGKGGGPLFALGFVEYRQPEEAEWMQRELDGLVVSREFRLKVEMAQHPISVSDGSDFSLETGRGCTFGIASATP